MKILIVDDNPEVRSLLRRLLSDLAEEIVECADGREALAEYAALQPDWVLMDIEIPTVDGLTATRQVCAAWPQAKVMIVTNHDNEALRQAALTAGARGYVVKDDLYKLRLLLAG
ncbi:MAG: response regulator transcription factor [Acidobacteriota bacterium]|nr:MAG: response regulator transcription factor [Acidobacteriota bacterium]